MAAVGLVTVLAPPGVATRALAQAGTGRIEGRLVRDGEGVAGASAVLNETRASQITEASGQFAFGGLAPGTYSVTLALGSNVVTISEIQVTVGSVAIVEESVDWAVGFTDVAVVRGASRQRERLTDVPAAASLVTATEIERKASSAQVARLVQFTPGAQVTQGGLWDFNVGTRGFNRALSRRVGVLLDGRDASLPFFGYQGWPAFSFPLDDLSSVEVVRGPSAALYGANTSGGVIVLSSKEPRFNPGGMVRVAFGARSTANLEGRWAGDLGNGWYARLTGGVRHSDGFAVSRVDGPEYSVACEVGDFGDCLPAEVVPVDGEDAHVYFGGIRFDKYLDGGVLLTMEAGHAYGGFGVFQVAGQRAKSIGRDGKRPWARVNLGGDSFNLAASYDGYAETSGYVGLSTGRGFLSDAHRWQVEGQRSGSFRQDRVQVIVGATAAAEAMDSYDPSTGAQSFLFRPISSNKQGVFGQTSWDVGERVRLLGAVRGDWSSLHAFQVSPRSSITYRLAPDQNLRLSYNRGFQVANSLEYFLEVGVAAPADLSPLNAYCTPFGVDCGFGQTPLLAVGNEDLDVEKVHTVEVGYKGVFVGEVLLTAEYFRSRSSDFVTSLLPQIGTALGRLNPRFGPWQEPDGLPTAIGTEIRSLVPLLSNHPDGSNVLVAASYANVGTIDTQGIDLGIGYFFAPGWRGDFTYSWFGFDVPDRLTSTEDLLLPNSPSHAFTAGLSYDRDGLGASAELRWVDDFRWADGFFLGNVESYAIVDVTARYPLVDDVSLGVDVSNLFDDRHWETFGGALIGRRALLSLQYDWD